MAKLVGPEGGNGSMIGIPYSTLDDILLLYDVLYNMQLPLQIVGRKSPDQCPTMLQSAAPTVIILLRLTFVTYASSLHCPSTTSLHLAVDKVSCPCQTLSFEIFQNLL